MTRFEHILVLIILILPMFALAPSLVARPNEVLSNQTEVDMALPAQFVHENLRVAVYTEDNTSLPTYATGGNYTTYYANVINLLESAGYTVTALTTQDILDYKLVVTDFDALVLPNQLPRESIINSVKDYWLGGGGILSFDGSIGFCFYAGLVDESLEGNFELVPTAVPGYWAYANVTGVIVEERHPVTKTFEVDDESMVPSGDIVILNGDDLPSIVGDRMINLITWNYSSLLPVVAAFENPDRGGKIVQIAGNCSSFASWQSQTAIDAINWLAPKPKGRILFDLSHTPAYGVDTWDTVGWTNESYYTWRNALVSRAYTFDKLLPSSSGNLTTENLAGYDMLIIPMSGNNYTASEIAAVTSWVNNGGGLFVMGDQTYNLTNKQELNRLLSGFSLSNNITVTASNTVNTFEIHPITEYCSSLQFVLGGALNYSGTAYPIWYDSDGNTVVVGNDYGNGRVILTGDLDFLGHNRIVNVDNFDFGVNVANWLTAATSEVLFYIDNADIANPYDAPAVDALNDLGIPFYLTYTEAYMNLSLHSQQWSLVILDSAWPGIYPYLDDFSSYLDTGGELIISWHLLNIYQSDPFYSKVGIGFSADYPNEQPFHIWSPSHGIFNYPNNYGALNFTPGYDIGDEGDLMTVYTNATAIAGLAETNQQGNATIALGYGGHVLWNSYLIDQLTGDLDDSTYADNFELWENEIAFMYYDRPIINHPDDVTYMETETGNEITWTPVADAGPWEYTVRENGSIIEAGHWSGGVIAINVDGVNASLTDYQLTVFDRLGYSASDLVILNVTEYVATTTTGTGAPPDPMLLIIIGTGAAVVIVIIIIVMKKKK